MSKFTKELYNAANEIAEQYGGETAGMPKFLHEMHENYIMPSSILKIILK